MIIISTIHQGAQTTGVYSVWDKTNVENSKNSRNIWVTNFFFE